MSQGSESLGANGAGRAVDKAIDSGTLTSSESLGANGAGRGPGAGPATASGTIGGGAGTVPPGGSGEPVGSATEAGGGIVITINRKEYRTSKPEMTARELKDMAGAPIHHMLILLVDEPGRAAGADDEPKADADIIRLVLGMRFRTVNAATFGSQAAIRVPPLLQDHIAQLESRGFEVEVAVDNAIYVVIKDYPIPEGIWDRTSSDLLIMAHDTYPNAALDMFWLDPPISRKGGPPDGAITETRNGREWQSFSWHIGGWDPAHDNLLTYLDVVNDRLSRDR